MLQQSSKNLLRFASEVGLIATELTPMQIKASSNHVNEPDLSETVGRRLCAASGTSEKRLRKLWAQVSS